MLTMFAKCPHSYPISTCMTDMRWQCDKTVFTVGNTKQCLLNPHVLQVLVTEREPVRALKEMHVLAKLTPTFAHLVDLGPVIERSTTQHICKHILQDAATPNRLQPCRWVHLHMQPIWRIFRRNTMHIHTLLKS